MLSLMALKIEDYALIGNAQTAALVGRDGSIDWMCVPRFDSSSCFAALLGNEDNGRWIIAPKSSSQALGKRKYWDNTLILETNFETETGTARLVDCMLTENGNTTVIRVVEGLKGKVEMKVEVVIRFDYGSTVPWVRKEDGGILAIAGSDNILLESDVKLRGENFRTRGEFDISEGEKKFFTLRYFHGTKAQPEKIKDPWASVLKAAKSWEQWSDKSTYSGRWKPQVMRSLITLKALTFKETGGIVAAPTTSLPEFIGGERNWDYRYCWLRDATFTLYSMMVAGYKEEASEWREWLLRAIAGKPSQIKILYGVAGERFNTEMEIPWLRGYEKSKPVRIGNAAHSQFQIDVYGELADTMYLASKTLKPSPNRKQGGKILRGLLENLENEWSKPDRGIWEIRGDPLHFVHSKVMAWVAFDRGIRMSEDLGISAPIERWKELRTKIHNEVMEKGF
jgi:GH15 family glucan-1,4-alpha-glucosidase